ncbi:hypothetical protein Tco_1402285 [Tanacetum coccineum]
MAASAKALIAEYASAPTPPSPPPSPLTPLSSILPHIPSPPLPLPSLPTLTSPTYVEAPLGYMEAMIRSRTASPLPLPAPSSPLLLPATDHRFEVGESSAAAVARQPGFVVTHATDYGFVDTDDMVGDMEETAPTTLEAVNQRVADLATTLAQDSHESCVRFEDAQDDRAYLRAQINMIRRGRRYFNTMAVALEREAMYARRAWAGSENRSITIEAYVRTLETYVSTLIAQTSSLQTQLTITFGRIQTLEAREPARTNDPEDADSSA